MMPQKLIVMIMSLIGGAVGLFAPVGVVKWLLRTEPEDAGILTLFFFPVWFLIVVAGLWIGRRLALLVTGGKRVLQQIASRLDPEHPDRDDSAQCRKAADGPSGRVEDLVVDGAAHRVGIRSYRSPVHGASPRSLPATITTGPAPGSMSASRIAQVVLALAIRPPSSSTSTRVFSL